MAIKGELFQRDGHLTTQTLEGIWKGEINPNSVEGRRVKLHLLRCTHYCNKRLNAITGDDLVKSYDKDENRGIMSRIRSFFRNIFGGNEPFHG